MSENIVRVEPDAIIPANENRAVTQQVITEEMADKQNKSSNETAPKDKSFSTNGGVGVEARDVNADVQATIGVDKIDKSVTVGDNSTLTINNDNSKTVNKNRFDKAIGMNQPEASSQADKSMGLG